jgi:hypothetical protein
VTVHRMGAFARPTVASLSTATASDLVPTV